MKKIRAAALVMLLALTLFCSCLPTVGPKTTFAPAGTEAPAVYTQTAYPKEVRLERDWLDPGFARTGDRYTIDDIIEALEGLRVTGTVQSSADDRTEIIRFIYEDGSEDRFEFEDGVWVKDGVRYSVEGYENVSRALDSMMEHFGGYELPTKFTGTPYIDDAEGYYWIFYGGGYGLGCGAYFTGFDGEWLENGTLFTWGVYDGVLHIFPEGEDEMQYPVSYGERSIGLGDMTLSETYTSELSALYTQWAGVGKRIEAELGR